MSHHIDDIFKRKLEKAPIDGHLEDWANARALLNLDKPKRRLFFLIWLALGLLFIGSTYAIITHSDSIFTNEENLINRKEKITPEISTSSSVATELTASSASNQSLENNQVSELDNTTELSQTIILNKNPQNQNSTEPIISLKNENSNSSGEPTEELKNGKSEIENIVKTGSSPDQNDDLEQSANKSFSNDEQTRGDITNNNSNDKKVYENLESEDVESNLANAINQKNEVGIIKGFAETVQFELLYKLHVLPLKGDMSEPVLPAIVQIEKEQKEPFDLSLGIYAGIDPIHSKLSGGLLLNHNFNAHWSINMGIGVRRSSIEKMRTYSGFDNRSALNAELISLNSYQTVSLDLPLRFSYHANRHSFFVGGMLERPFSLNGTQEVTYFEEEEDVAVDSPAAGSGFAPAAPQVFNAVQNYNLNAIPEQKRFFYYGLLGYGYELTERLQISGAAAYRFNSKPSVSPLLDTDQLGLTDSSRWLFELRLSYLFK